MTLDQLRIFVTVAELQHVTRAAEQLNMTQSSVSAAISALEARHQIMLFDRVGRGIEITAEGAQFLDQAQAVLAQVNVAETMLADLAGTRRGSLTIFASQTIANYWLPAYVVAYMRRYPNIRLNVEIGNTSESAAAVLGGHAQLGFIEGDVDLPVLQMTDVAEDRLVLIVGSLHPWAVRAPDLPGDIRCAKWALREAGSGTRSSFEQALAAYGLLPTDLNVALELPSNEALCTAVAAGELATVMSESVVVAGVAAGRLVKLPLDIGRRTFRLINHKDRHLTRAALAFMELLPSV